MARRYVIVGAGLVGLFAAFVLRREGHAVTVCSAGPAGAGAAGVASWAGGGILSPLRPWTAPEAVTRLVFPSVDSLPALLARLEVDTGLPGGWRGGGMRVFPAGPMAGTEPAAENPDAPRAWGRRHGIVVESCRDPLRGAGVWLPGIGSVHNPSLWRLLAAAVAAAGVRLVVQPVPAAGAVAGPALARWAAPLADAGGGADAVIVCAGAWTGRLLGRPDVIAPVRGQMARVALARPLTEIVQVHDRYLVPRGARGAVVGSTLEPQAGFAAVPTAAGRADLEQWLAAQAGWLGAAHITHHWAGLRPGTADGVPLIGALDRQAGVWVAAGHHRNGICSALGSAELLADLLAGRAPATDPAPYDPVRRLTASC